MPDRERYITTWERQERYGRNPVDIFRENFEVGRGMFEQPLKTAYRTLAKSEFPGGTLLCLGIGTGQVEQMIGLDSKRITAIEVNPQLAGVARQRLSRATIKTGRFEDALPTLGHLDTTFASESLDCVNPPSLNDLLKLARQKTDRLVAVQIFNADDEFYSYHAPREGRGSHGGPGIEGWTDRQRELVVQGLIDKDVAYDSTNPARLIDDLQTAAMSFTGIDINIRIVDRLMSFGYQLDRIQNPVILGLSPLSRISAILETITESLKDMRDQLFTRSGSSDETRGRHIAVATTHRLAQIIEGGIQTSAYFTILEDSLSSAGFSSIDHKVINTSGTRTVDQATVASQLNESLTLANVTSLPKPKKGYSANLGLWLPGAPVTFFEPQAKPYKSVSMHYLTAV